MTKPNGKPKGNKPRKREPQPGLTRAETAAAVFSWTTRLRSTLGALIETVDAARLELIEDGSPLYQFLCPCELATLSSALVSALDSALVLYPDNPLNLNIPAPLAAAKGEGAP